MYPMLEVTAEQYGEKLAFTDALGFGAIVLLQGMVTVFAVLCIIWGCLVLFKRVFTAFEKKRSAASVAQPVAPAVTEQKQESDDEIIAVIAAAIAAAETETPGARFKVVSFKRI